MARVEALLRAHDDAEQFMAAPTIEGAGSHGASGLGTSPGTRIGPDVLGPLLGEGGFGRVYAADQTHPVERRVAMKILHSGTDSRAVVSRFESERQALAVMDHPGIAKVFDAGETDAGLPYFVMECVEGRPITEYCEENGLGLRARLELFGRVCLAVQHAHQKGIIHRDLKPQNVLVATVDGKPAPKVIDFGIAKAVGPALGERTMMTVEGQFIGTPAYMSPEQVSGARDIDTRSDVYTLGVMLYEMLTGVLPFDADRLRSNPLPAVAAQIICAEDPPMPSTRAVRHAGDATRITPAHLRGDLDWIVMRAMEKDPARRYPTAFAMASDIRRHLDDEPVEAGPPGGAYRMRKFARRHRAEVVAAALVVIAMVGGLVASLVFAGEKERQSRITARELEMSRESVAFLSDILAGIDPAVARGEDRTLLLAMLNDAQDRLDRSPPEHARVESEMRGLLGESLHRLAEFEQAEAQTALAIARSTEALGADHISTLELRKVRGSLLVELSLYDEARDELNTTIDALRRTVGEEDERTMSAMFDRAVLERRLGNTEEARDRFERVLELRLAALGERHEDTMSVRNSLATIMGDQGDIEGAAEQFRMVIDFQSDTLGEDHPHTLATRNNLADVYLSAERFDDAALILGEVIEIKRRVFDGDHPSLAISLNNQAHAYRELGRLDDAEALVTEAIGICERTGGVQDRRTLILQNTLASIMIEDQRPAEARALLEAVLPACEEVMGASHRLTHTMLKQRSKACLDSGDAEAGAASAARLIALADATLAPDHPDLRGYRRLLAECLIATESLEDALATLEEASGLEPSDPRDDLSRVKTADLLARVSDRLGRGDDGALWRQMSAASEGESG